MYWEILQQPDIHLMNFLFLSPLFPEHPPISVCCPCSCVLAPFHVTASWTLPAVTKQEMWERLHGQEGQWWALLAGGSEEILSCVQLEVTACQPAQVCGTNGISPPVPAGMWLRGKVSLIFLHIVKCPGTNNNKSYYYNARVAIIAAISKVKYNLVFSLLAWSDFKHCENMAS